MFQTPIINMKIVWCKIKTAYSLRKWTLFPRKTDIKQIFTLIPPKRYGWLEFYKTRVLLVLTAWPALTTIGKISVPEMVTKQSFRILVYPEGLSRGIYKNEKALLCIHWGDQDLSFVHHEFSSDTQKKANLIFPFDSKIFWFNLQKIFWILQKQREIQKKVNFVFPSVQK